MNKYTLQFRNHQTEEKYLKYACDNLQMNTFKLSSTLYILYYLFSLSLSILNYDEIKVVIRIISITILFLSNFMVRKWNKTIDIGLMTLNLIISLFEWERDDSYDKYNLQLYGNNTMLVHTLFMFTQNFKYAIVTNALLLLNRLMITISYSEILYLQLGLAILTVMGLTYILYQFQKFQRSSFQLTLEDNSWEILLPLIITRPFLNFTFDEDRFTFQMKMINRLDFPFEEENTVHSFLKESKIANQTLQEFIYFKIIQNKEKYIPAFAEELQITLERKKMKILLSGCFLSQPNFILILQSEDKDIKLMQQKFKQQHLKYYEFFKNHIKQTCKIITRSLVHNQPILIVKMLISHKESLLFQEKNLSIPKQINLTRILTRLIGFLQNLNYQINIKILETVNIFTYKPCLYGLFYEIMKLMNQNNLYSVKCFTYENETSVSIKGLLELPNSNLYQQCEKCIIKQIIKHDQSKNILNFSLHFCVTQRTTNYLLLKPSFKFIQSI